MANPRFPLYIPSKGRSQFQLTATVLAKLGVPYNVVVEEHQYRDYKNAGLPGRIIVLDPQYQRDYDTFDDLGTTKSVGPGAARNFIWEHSISEGHDWHWVMDDNIRAFHRLHRNKRLYMGDGTGFKVMEDFALRYSNLAMCGPNYRMFVPSRDKRPPFVMNTRIYSCNLIRNDVPLRWRGRYNEDTDLSLRMLKAGWCTVQFNAFLQDKIATQKIPGGNTEEFYAKEGTHAKSTMLQQMHPDVTTVTWRYSRVHHYVDYNQWKKRQLIRRPDAEIATGDTYDMRLVKRG